MAEASVESMPQTQCEVKNVTTAQAAVNNVTRAQAATKDMPQVQARVVRSIEEKNRDNNRTSKMATANVEDFEFRSDDADRYADTPSETTERTSKMAITDFEDIQFGSDDADRYTDKPSETERNASSKERELTREEIIEEMKMNLEENKYNKLEENMKAMMSTKVLIAVIGQSGVGKSSFINNMLGLGEGDECAAEVGDGDTTTRRTVYSHPQNRNLEFADLPGVDFEMSDKYLEKMKAEIHDFFLIFYPGTIGDPEKKVIEKLLALKKKFALVRTKADEMTRRREKPLHQSIATSKEKCRTNLKKFGIETEVEIFVISNINLEIGEFNKLFAFIETNLSRIKREALTAHVHAQTDEIIEKKEKLLTRRAWKAAACMGIVACIPIPGIDIPINVAALAEEVIFALHIFGLNFDMLVKFPLETFMQLKTAFDIHQKGLNSFIIANIANAPVMISSNIVQQALEVLLPVIGSLITGSVSYTFYFNFLRDIIKRLAEDARTLQKLHVESVV